jgi:hypothetical protein
LNADTEQASYQSGTRHRHASNLTLSHQKELIMKQKHQSVFLAGLLALAVGLSACSSWRGGGMGSSGSSGTSGETGSSGTATGTSTSGGMSGTGGGTGSQGSGSWGGSSSGSSGTSGTAGSSSGYDTSGSAGMEQQRGASAAATTPNATVAAIEVMPRSGGTTMEGETAGANTAQGSSSAGATGSSPDRVYRVTLRMDDGSTQVVTQQTTPDFRTGDRVSLAGGVIQH